MEVIKCFTLYPKSISKELLSSKPTKYIENQNRNSKQQSRKRKEEIEEMLTNIVLGACHLKNYCFCYD
jgi:hypothetical protein